MLQRLRELVAPITHRVVLIGAPDAKVQAAGQALHHLLAEVPDLLFAAVAEVGTGALRATYTTRSQWRVSEMVGPCIIGLRRLQAGSAEPNQLEEVLITVGNQVHALRLTPDGSRVLYLAVDSGDLNLALTREVMRAAMLHLLAPAP